MCSSRGDIGDRRLLESDLPEQTFRDLDNQLMSVLSLDSLSVRIFLTILRALA